MTEANQTTPRNTPFLLALAGAGLLGAGAWWWHAEAAPDAPAPVPPAPLDAVHPQRADVAASFDADAMIEPWQAADLYAKVPGYVATLSHDLGDHVRAGTVLATLAEPEIDGQLGEARATVAAREADLALAEASLKRDRSLHAAQGLTDQALDEAEARTRVARAGLDLARASLAKASAFKRYASVTAPFDGVITRRLVNRGSFVAPPSGPNGAALLSLADTSKLRVAAAAPAAQAGAVKPGSPVRLLLPGSKPADPPVTGTIARTAGALDPATHTLRLEIDLPNAAGKLLAGAFLRARVELARHNQVIAVPAGAVGSDATGSFVAVVRGGKVEHRAVAPGLSDGTLTEVSGVSPADVVIASAKAAPPAGVAVAVKVAP